MKKSFGFRKEVSGLLMGIAMAFSLIFVICDKGVAQSIKPTNKIPPATQPPVPSHSNVNEPVGQSSSSPVTEDKFSNQENQNSENKKVTITRLKKSLSVPANTKSVEAIAIKEQTDTAIKKAYIKATIAYYYAQETKNLSDAENSRLMLLHQRWALENNRGVFVRQQFTASLIFLLVAIVVLSGLVFSAMQFRMAAKGFRKKGNLASDTNIKASLSG